MRRRSHRSGNIWTRWKRRVIVAVGVFILSPYVLTVLYIAVPPPSTLMLARLLTFRSVERDWVSLDRMSPQLVAAVVSSEDDAFCEHFGFDFTQMEKTIEQAASSKRRLRGTSTITMQAVKNLYLWSGRSWLRKFIEAPLTLWTELILSKRRILEIYLNVAQWGDGIYGAEAAARRHFGLSARALSLRQATLLATSLPNPIRRHAARPGPDQAQLALALERRLARGGPDLSCLR